MTITPALAAVTGGYLDADELDEYLAYLDDVSAGAETMVDADEEVPFVLATAAALAESAA